MAVAALLFLTASPLAFGCGDKFVVLGRGARFNRAFAARHPGSILIYMYPASRMQAAEKDYKLEATLRAAGHKPRLVTSPAELGEAISSGKYDLVLADLPDAATVQREAGATPSNPEVIPVLYKPTPSELARVEHQNGCYVRASSKNEDLLAIVDQAMKSKLKGKGARCQKRS
jgi:ABC-type amino acid transport substrate-binding protein